MRPDQAVIWYRRMSAVYALGAWTLLGSLFFLGGKKSKLSGDEVEQKDVSTNEIPEQTPPMSACDSKLFPVYFHPLTWNH
ncbi:small integral membrane protein 26 isoform X3 [Pteropus alecto]|uniref:small integral membrane protein 26 isoform X3 n=1 Tax=Pteropus alecto TaxID=9402 RepID=UPI000D531505|nr:small integral membrane protein 26 isoform X3 [Pteropus alecto]